MCTTRWEVVPYQHYSEFSPGIRALPGRGGRRIDHSLSPSRGTRTSQGRGQGPGTNWGNAQVLSTHRIPPPCNSNNICFAPSSSQPPPWAGGWNSYELGAGRPRGNGQYNSLGEQLGQFRATRNSAGPLPWQPGQEAGGGGGRWVEEAAHSQQQQQQELGLQQWQLQVGGQERGGCSTLEGRGGVTTAAAAAARSASTAARADTRRFGGVRGCKPVEG